MKGKSNLSNALKGKSHIPLPEKKEILFSLKDFDHTQGQSFAEWEKTALFRRSPEQIEFLSRKAAV